jgi:hypothetical protein
MPKPKQKLRRPNKEKLPVHGAALSPIVPKLPPRPRWAEASRQIAPLGDDKLVLGELANEEDANFMW